MSKQIQERLVVSLVQLLMFLPALGVTGSSGFSFRVCALVGLVGLSAWGVAGSRRRSAHLIAASRWIFLAGTFGLAWRSGSLIGDASESLRFVGQGAAILCAGFLALVVIPLGQSFWLGILNASFPETALAKGRRFDVGLENSRSVSLEFRGCSRRLGERVETGVS